MFVRVYVCVGDGRGLSTRNVVFYSPKGGGQGKSPVHKVSCSLWVSTPIAKILKKAFYASMATAFPNPPEFILKIIKPN